MKTQKYSFLASIATLCLAATVGHAATIVYNFNGSATADATGGAAVTAPASSNDFGSSVAASVWTLTSSGNTIVAIDQSTNANAASVGAAARVSKRAANATHTFSVTIPSGVFVNFTSLAFRYGSFGGDTTVATPNLLSYSISNGGTGDLANPITQAVVGSGSAAQGTNYTVALSGLAGETNTTLTFTFADLSQGNNSSLENQFTFMDNIVLTGVVVPEPSTALLSGLGLLGFLAPPPELRVR